MLWAFLIGRAAAVRAFTPGQQFENRVAVPGVAFEGAANLIGKAKSFSHGAPIRASTIVT